MIRFLLFTLLFLQPAYAQVDITKGANGSLIARPKGESAVGITTADTKCGVARGETIPSGCVGERLMYNTITTTVPVVSGTWHNVETATPPYGTYLVIMNTQWSSMGGSSIIATTAISQYSGSTTTDHASYVNTLNWSSGLGGVAPQNFIVTTVTVSPSLPTIYGKVYVSGTGLAGSLDATMLLTRLK